MPTYMRPVPPTDMQLVLHKGGWLVSVSPTLVGSNLTMTILEEGLNNKLDESPLWFLL